MSVMPTLIPVLNMGKLSDGRYKFSFATSAGTLFSEVSVGKRKAGSDERSDEEKRADALTALGRIAQELKIAIQGLQTS